MRCTMPCAQQASAESSSSCTISCAACHSLARRCFSALLSSAWLTAISVRLCTGDLHEPAHLFALERDERGELLRCIGDDREPEALQALGNARGAQRFHDLRIELLQDRPWRGGRHCEAIPHVDLEPRQAGFVRGWYLRRLRVTLEPGQRDGA